MAPHLETILLDQGVEADTRGSYAATNGATVLAVYVRVDLYRRGADAARIDLIAPPLLSASSTAEYDAIS